MIYRPQRKLLLYRFLQDLNLKAPNDTKDVIDYYATQISMVSICRNIAYNMKLKLALNRGLRVM
jgi:hypothetical protein